MTKLEAQIDQFKKAVQRLKEILGQNKTDVTRDSAIKRFELVFDLSWKTIKSFLQEKKGVTCNSPKDCFRGAYQKRLIHYEDAWMTMADWRNASVHTYKEELAESLYADLPTALKNFEDLLKNLLE